MANNGSSSIEEPNLSELGREETMPSQIDMENDSRLMSTQSSDHGEVRHTNNFLTSQVQEETSETHLPNVWMFKTVIENMLALSSNTATMEPTKDGSLTEEEFISQDTHLEMELDSRSRQQ